MKAEIRRLGPFLLGRSFGRGALGEAFLARTPWPSAPFVCLKLLDPGIAASPDLASRLEHPNVISVIAAGKAASQSYVASELVLGRNVEQIVERLESLGRTAPLSAAIRLFADVLAGLTWLHGLPRLHGAVTPGNVIVTYGGVAKLSDTGLAMLALAQRPGEDPRRSIRSAEHLAPEVRSKSPATAASDLFAAASTFGDLFAPHAQEASTLAALLERMRAPDPALRPQSARDALEALHRAAPEGDQASRVAVGRWLSELFAKEKADALAEIETLGSDEQTQVEEAAWELQSFGTGAGDETTTREMSPHGEGDEPTAADGFSQDQPTLEEIEAANAALPRLSTLPAPDVPPPPALRLASLRPLDGVAPRPPNVRTLVLDEDQAEIANLPTRPPSDPPLPCSFGGYTLLEKLGEGGMADVFLADRTAGDGAERCVIKRIAPALRLDREIQEMFLDEAKIARLIDHPNIVSCFDSGAIDGQAYIALELIEGLELGVLIQRLAPDRIPGWAVLEIALAIARALDYAHRLKGEDQAPLDLVHRDVSPENILISWSGEVKLLDFGISRFKDRVHATGIGIIKGKVGYMSPEMLGAKEVDGRSDLFQLGVTIAEILGQKRLFSLDVRERPRTAEQTRVHLERHLAGAGHVDGALFDLLTRLCSPDAKNRPASARALIGELERIQKSAEAGPPLKEVIGRLAPPGRIPAELTRTAIEAKTAPRSPPPPGIALGRMIGIALAIVVASAAATWVVLTFLGP